MNTELFQVVQALHGQLEPVEAKLLFKINGLGIQATTVYDSEKDILSMVVPAGTDIDFELPEGEMSAECFETISNICNMTNPSSILEIGFRRGNSALMWLLNSSATLLSIDIEEFPIKSIQLLESTFKDRFSYRQCDSQNLNLDSTYDLIFIDGDHTFVGLRRDVEMSLKLNPKYLVFDDYYHNDHHEDMKKVIEIFNLQIIKLYRTHQGQALIKIR